MAKDYYKILGVNKDASQDDIKKAFRKASLKWHPDKWSDKSDKERTNAEEKFKEITEANDVLSDPDKRSKYDQFGENWEQASQGGFNGFEDIEDIMKHMGGGMFDFFNRGHNSRQNRGPQPGKDVQTQYEIGINEIFNGINKQIEIEVNGRCKTCNGSGGDVEVCSHCHGTGYQTQTHYTGFGTVTQQMMCPYCHGTGKIIKKKCKDCNGTGIRRIKRNINLNIKPFTPNGAIMKFTGMGYESQDPNGLNGDLLVQIIYNIDTSKYAIQGNNIYEKLKVQYYDALLGKELKITLPNNKQETIKIKPLSKEGDKIILNNKGINGGNYIYIISIEMPNNISSDEKKLLEKIKNLH